MGDQDLKAIRSAVQRGGVLGSERFKEAILVALGARTEYSVRGRPRALSKQGTSMASGDWTVIIWKDISALTPFG